MQNNIYYILGKQGLVKRKINWMKTPPTKQMSLKFVFNKSYFAAKLHFIIVKFDYELFSYMSSSQFNV